MGREAGRSAVFFFCADLDKDPVAPRVFAAVSRIHPTRKNHLVIDGFDVLEVTHGESSVLLVRTANVLSHRYADYLPHLNAHFADCDVAVHVNWHGGERAPDRIFTVHTVGDIVSGHYCPAKPQLMRALLHGLESERRAAGLSDFSVTSEATHWSGIPNGLSPRLLDDYPVALMDLEIGSSAASWSNESAAAVVARAITRIFDSPDDNVVSLLCAGGTHLEAAFSEAVLTSIGDRAIATSHILSKIWLAQGEYGTPTGMDKLRACARAIVGGVHAVVFHEDVKGDVKAQLEKLAGELRVPLVKRKALRDPNLQLA